MFTPKLGSAVGFSQKSADLARYVIEKNVYICAKTVILNNYRTELCRRFHLSMNRFLTHTFS